MSDEEKMDQLENQEEETNENESNEQKLPFFLEALFTLSQIIIILTGGITAIVSLIADVSYLQVILRASLALLVMGLLMWLVNWYSIRATLNSVEDNLQDWQKQEPTGEQLNL